MSTGDQPEYGGLRSKAARQCVRTKFELAYLKTVTMGRAKELDLSIERANLLLTDILAMIREIDELTQKEVANG